MTLWLNILLMLTGLINLLLAPYCWQQGLSYLAFGNTLAFLITLFLLIWVNQRLLVTLNRLDRIAASLGSKGGHAAYRESLRQLEEKGAREIGQLAFAFRRYLDDVFAIMQTLEEEILRLAGMSEAMFGTTSQLSASIAEQSSAVAETKSVVAEVVKTSKQTANLAGTISQFSMESADQSQQGRQRLQHVVTAMNNIREQMDKIAANILSLTEKNRSIGDIILSVSEIADQSNILALNASIEAAKAGEFGKGFAVVATEVRALAEQSKEATNQIRQILNEIQAATNAAVMATEEGIKRVSSGVKSTAEADNLVNKAADKAAEMVKLATEIKEWATRQELGMEEIMIAMEEITKGTMQNVTSNQELEKQAHELREMGIRINDNLKQVRS